MKKMCSSLNPVSRPDNPKRFPFLPGRLNANEKRVILDYLQTTDWIQPFQSKCEKRLLLLFQDSFT